MVSIKTLRRVAWGETAPDADRAKAYKADVNSWLRSKKILVILRIFVVNVFVREAISIF
jgi:hypothetical protein